MIVNQQWEQFLTPEIVRDRLISTSLYITAFEMLTESVIGRLRSFYVMGLNQEGDIVDEEYETSVLSRNKSPLYASLDWLIENQVVDKSDLDAFERIKSTRNLLAHELPSLVLSGVDLKHIERFHELIALLRKIEVWWVVNLEIPTNPDFDGKEIDEEGIVPGPVLMIQIMLEVIGGNEEYLKHLRGTRPD